MDFYLILIGWFIQLNISATNCNLQKANFVYHHWAFTSIYQPLSYPFSCLGEYALTYFSSQCTDDPTYEKHHLIFFRLSSRKFIVLPLSSSSDNSSFLSIPVPHRATGLWIPNRGGRGGACNPPAPGTPPIPPTRRCSNGRSSLFLKIHIRKIYI